MAASFTNRQGSATGVTTASKVSANSVDNPPDFVRSQPREPFSRTPKMALISQYPIAGSADQLMVVNVHSINFVVTSKFETQLQQIEEAISSHRGPLLLAGDFNTWISSRMIL